MIDNLQNTNTRKNWQECPRDKKQSRWSTLHAALYPTGEIAITRFTHEQLGSPEAYVLLYDQDKHMIGLLPASPAVKQNAYRAHEKGPHGGRRIRGYRLMREFNLYIDNTVQFPRCVIDHTGTLILDLKDCYPVRRNKKVRREY
jgi:hypothetical protein